MTPLFHHSFLRKSGILLHPTSLPSVQGIGCLGYSAHTFIQFLADAGFGYWQVCPLGPTGYGDSPYQTFSAFAGNPYLIDLTYAVDQGWIKRSFLEPLHALPHAQVDFGTLYHTFWPILQAVYKGYEKEASLSDHASKSQFEANNAFWLRPYALFMALKNHFKGAPWHEWPKALRSYEHALKTDVAKSLEGEAEAWIFYQYLFDQQWKNIRAYAKTKGISIIGDMPIFVAEDSADVWTWPDLFDLDAAGHLQHQAGVPPDYFSADGQLWGNPLYRWDHLAHTGYEWWLKRIEKNHRLYDVIRLDHFRGFESYWEVPAKAKTARDGQWKKGPGLPFFKAIKEAFPHVNFIAEDLGDLTPEVHALLKATGLPGMAILQFAFGGTADNPYLPHNYLPHRIVYSGSHDNDTSLNWYQTAPENTRDHVRRYLRVNGQEVGWDLIRAALASVAHTAIIPMQDMLSLGVGARMNLPGQAQGNWIWRYREPQLEHLYHQGTVSYLNALNKLYNRI